MEKMKVCKSSVSFGLQVADKLKTLTLKIDLQTLAEFNVASQVFRARSVSSFLHEYVVGRIVEARRMVPVEEFQEMVEREKQFILERSEAKSQTYRPGARSTTINVGNDEQGKLRKTK